MDRFDEKAREIWLNIRRQEYEPRDVVEREYFEERAVATSLREAAETAAREERERLRQWVEGAPPDLPEGSVVLTAREDTSTYYVLERINGCWWWTNRPARLDFVARHMVIWDPRWEESND